MVAVRTLGLGLLCTLAACHTRPHDADEGIRGGVTEGVLAPLADVNVRREEIPPILRDLNVYAKPVPDTCTGIEIEIRDLETYVGSDLDSLDTGSALTLRDRAMDMVDDQAYSLVSDFTTDFIPFRSIVRRATGANAHDKAIRTAYVNGRLRRSYLKGAGFTMGCDSPAAPHVKSAVNTNGEAEARPARTDFHVLEVPPAW